MSITKELTSIVSDAVSGKGYEFVELNYGKRGGNWFLQVFADKPGGLTLKDCEIISENLGYELDRHSDLLKHSYKLEVSSPGLDRPLKKEADFARYIGHTVNIRLFKPVNNSRDFTGRILKPEDGKILIGNQGEVLSFSIEDIASAKLEININEI